MTTTEPTTLPAWLNLEAIHPPEELAKLPALVQSARGVLEAVAAFNRDHLATMYEYYGRPGGPGDPDVVDQVTGMKEADGYLMLAAHIITCTVVGQGEVTTAYAETLLDRYAGIVEGVRSLYVNLGYSPLPVFGEVAAH